MSKERSDGRKNWGRDQIAQERADRLASFERADGAEVLWAKPERSQQSVVSRRRREKLNKSTRRKVARAEPRSNLCARVQSLLRLTSAFLHRPTQVRPRLPVRRSQRTTR